MASIIDPDLLDALDRMNGVPFHGEVWRVSWKSRDPLAGSPGGGRWTPSNGVEVLYTSLDEDGAIAEVYAMLAKAPVASSSAKTINRIELVLDRVLALSQEDLIAVGIEDPLARRPDLTKTQVVGEAAYMLNYQGVIVPSARWDCSNLILFLDVIDPDTQITLKHTDDLNWPAWVEAQGMRARS